MAEIVGPDGRGAEGDAPREPAARTGTGTPVGQPSVTPERWLHYETVDEARARRARQGLAAPPERASKSQPGAAPGRYVLTIALAVLLGLLVGAIAAVVVFNARVPLPGLWGL